MAGPSIFVVIESSGAVKSPVGYFTSRTEAERAKTLWRNAEIKESPLSLSASKWFQNYKDSQYNPD